MQEEIAWALAEYDDDLCQAANRYRIQIMPALDRYHAAVDRAKETLRAKLDNIVRKEPKP